MGVLVTIWETLSRAVANDRSDEIVSSGLDLQADGARSQSSAEGPILFEDSIVDYDGVRGARDFPAVAEEAHDMPESVERANPIEPEGENEALDAEAPDLSPEFDTSGLDHEGSSGFGELSLDIFASDEVDDRDDADLPYGLAEVDVNALLVESQSVRERLIGSPRSESESKR